MSAPRPRGYAWVFAHSRFGGQRTGREVSLTLASTGKDGRGGCADLPACGEALAPLRPHRLERPVAGPGGDGYAIWSLTGLAVYDRYHLWRDVAGCYVLTRVRPLWAHVFALSSDMITSTLRADETLGVRWVRHCQDASFCEGNCEWIRQSGAR